MRTKSRSTAALMSVARIGLGCLLLATAAGKLLDNRGFAAILGTYQLLPEAILLPAGLAVGLAEAAVGLWLLGGWRLGAAAVAAFVMHIAYFAVLALTMARGIVLSNCGCFGIYWGRPLGYVSLAEDLVVAAVAFLLWRWAARSARGP